MKIKEITEKINKEIENLDYFAYYGIRFENKGYNVNDIVANSKHNPNRVDERDFPEFGSDEYENLIELDGSSSWILKADGFVNDRFTNSYTGWRRDPLSEDDFAETEHCYIIGSDYDVTHYDADEDEIVLKNAVVVAVIF